MSAQIMRIGEMPGNALIDERMIETLRATLGEKIFGEIFEDSLFEVTERLARTRRLAERGDLAGVARHAHDLVAVAGQIGLTSVSGVARDLEACCAAGDYPAMRAVAARLDRVGEDSLIAIVGI